MKHLKFILAIVLMVVVILLFVQNHGAMSTQVSFKVDFGFIHYETSHINLYSIVAIAFFFGLLVTGLYGILERFRMSKNLKMLRKDLADKEKELDSLRTLPITSEDVGPEHTNST